MQRKPINPQVLFWPIADAVRDAKHRNSSVKPRQFVKRRLAAAVGVPVESINPRQRKVLDTYVSKIVRLAFPATPAANKALQQAREAGRNVNVCLQIARGKDAPDPAPAVGAAGSRRGGAAERPKLTRGQPFTKARGKNVGVQVPPSGSSAAGAGSSGLKPFPATLRQLTAEASARGADSVQLAKMLIRQAHQLISAAKT